MLDYVLAVLQSKCLKCINFTHGRPTFNRLNHFFSSSRKQVSRICIATKNLTGNPLIQEMDEFCEDSPKSRSKVGCPNPPCVLILPGLPNSLGDVQADFKDSMQWRKIT